jgi:hypothetical protein
MEHSIKFEIYHVIQIEGTLMAICWPKLQALILLKNLIQRETSIINLGYPWGYIYIYLVYIYEGP